MNKISAGRIVCAVIRDAKGALITRPAIITRTWGDGASCVQATVFPDAVNDGLGEVVGKSSLYYDETQSTENSWHWPVVELPLAAELKSVPSFDWVGLAVDSIALAHEIEKLPASSQATELSCMASRLVNQIREASSSHSR